MTLRDNRFVVIGITESLTQFVRWFIVLLAYLRVVWDQASIKPVQRFEHVRLIFCPLKPVAFILIPVQFHRLAPVLKRGHHPPGLPGHHDGIFSALKKNRWAADPVSVQRRRTCLPAGTM